MLADLRRTRPRSRPRRLLRHRAGLWTETLEARRLLVAPPINVAAGLPIASGLPLPGLATGLGLATTAQSLPSATATVAPASVAAPVMPTTIALATGPATTLSPLMNDAETANATASEVARPTPGRSDRISIILPAPDVVSTIHLHLGDPVAIYPGPEVGDSPPSPVSPLPESTPLDLGPAAPPLAPPVAAPIPAAAPAAEREPIALEVWDAALAQITLPWAGDEATAPSRTTEATLAGGALLAAWTGWKYGPRTEGRSRRRPQVLRSRGGADG